MLQNYFKVAWRNLTKNKVFAFINIIGLSIGIGFLLLTASYVWQELNVNNVIEDKDRVFILQSKWKEPNMGLELTTMAPIGKALKEDYPQLVEHFYHHDGISSIVSKGNKYFTEELQPGDSTFLQLFGFDLLYGDIKTALNEPNTLILSASKAVKYFGRTDVMGETLTLQSFSGSKENFKITGVLKDLPFNTITNYNNASNEFFLSPGSLRFFDRHESFESWQNPFVINYIKLREGVAPERLKQPLAQLIKANTTEQIYKNLEIYPVGVKDYYLQLNNGASKRMLYIISFVALFIILMAVINFINISVSNSLSRLKETGIRKVLGGSRFQIIKQHLAESLLFAALAGLVALLIYGAARPAFIEMIGKEIPTLNTYPVYYALFPIVVVLLIGLLAGGYPAFILSIQPSTASLKGKLKTIGEKVLLRRSLIGLQFTTAILVFIGAVVIHQQVSFFFDSNLGYDKAYVLNARTPRDWTSAGVQRMETIRNEFAKVPAIIDVTLSYEIPDGQSGSISNRLYRASQDSSAAITTTSLVTDEHYLETYGIKMAAGQFFKGSMSDSTAMVLNETAAKALGWSNIEEAIGQQLRLDGVPQVFTVSGVVKDFHFNTMHEPIVPSFFRHVSGNPLYRYLSFKVKPGTLSTTIAELQSQWIKLLPNAPFDYSFMDETLARWYQNELQLKKASQIATFLSLVIVLLGVIGIVLVSVARKVKEVGIRRVLGASVQQIIWLFAKEFSWILLLANIIAAPIAWLVLRRWLMTYAYRIQIGITPFVATGLVLLLLTGLIILLLVYKKVKENPVEALRSE